LNSTTATLATWANANSAGTGQWPKGAQKSNRTLFNAPFSRRLHWLVDLGQTKGNGPARLEAIRLRLAFSSSKIGKRTEDLPIKNDSD
jgi:hypothetical protein